MFDKSPIFLLYVSLRYAAVIVQRGAQELSSDV